MDKQGEPLAHSANATGVPQTLRDHLLAVAKLASQFAQYLGESAPNLAYVLGLFHDLGKATKDFQRYLELASRGRPAKTAPHSVWGALILCEYLQECGFPLASLPVLGHHAGLKEPGAAALLFKDAAEKEPEKLQEVATFFAQLLARIHAPVPEIQPLRQGSASANRSHELYLRLLLSALIDADRLDTEAHFNPDVARLRKGFPGLDELWSKFENDQNQLVAAAADTPVNKVRKEVYESSLAAANLPPGFFRLTVPTGGGKTRSGLAFALKHALSNDLRRIIVAIPYTSIIEQTADEYKNIFGNKAVLEHHSALQLPENESENPNLLKLRLAAENWDHPLVVTTTVQLFESLFSNHPGRVRKLHNLARSVILIDEVQTLPLELLRPTLDALRQLVEKYGATVVFSTATQPAFELSKRVPEFASVQITEIVPNYRQHFDVLRRVTYEYRKQPEPWSQIAAELAGKPQVMVVLNTRKDAIALLDALGDDPATLHLSTLLCGAHRRQVLSEVLQRLRSGREVRLVSTQVVEAGVDLDFPEVWRAIGPLDRIVQAAGRCNREGQMDHPGRVVIFSPTEGGSPYGTYRSGLGEAEALLANPEYGPGSLYRPAIFREYFRRLFEVADQDAYKIQDLREKFNYPEVATEYRLIKDDTVPVVVPYEDSMDRLHAFLVAPSRLAWQKLQPYLVNLFRHDVTKYHNCLEQVGDNLYKWICKYDEVRGISEGLADPADLII